MPLTTADRLEILELLGRYAHAIDSGDGEAYADCFTDDGVIELRRAGLARPGAGRPQPSSRATTTRDRAPPAT